MVAAVLACHPAAAYTRDNTANTALHHACRVCAARPEVVQLMLGAHPAAATAVNRLGASP